LRAGGWAAALAAAVLAGCATMPTPAVRRLPLARLPGWEAENHAAAFAAIRAACVQARRPLAVCRGVLAQGVLDEPRAKAFLERRFRAEPVAGEGLLTGYFAPLYPARHAPDARFDAPVRPAPADPHAAGDRAAIESRPAPDALAWMRPEDLFFLQIQGSGELRFRDGAMWRAAYAADNGRAYASIAAALARRGRSFGRDTSGGALHAWLARHRGPAADEAMRLDPRYIFFRLSPDDGAQPIGAAGAPLIAGRSVAVDPAHHPYDEILWIDAGAPSLPGARSSYRRLVVALDAGAAIKGEVRADLYLGQGAAAGREAGRVSHRLRLYRIVPSRGSRR